MNLPQPPAETAPLTVHYLKVWSEFVPALADGSKTFEARKDDRAFRVGDTLVLCEWDRECTVYLKWSQHRTVTYKLSGPAWGIESGYCVLGLSPLPAAPAQPATAAPPDLQLSGYECRCAICGNRFLDADKRAICCGGCARTTATAAGECPACGLHRCEDQGVCDGVIYSRKKAAERAAASSPTTIYLHELDLACAAYKAHRESVGPTASHEGCLLKAIGAVIRARGEAP